MCRSGAFVFTLFLLTSALNAQILPKGNVFVGYSYNRAGTSQPGAFNTDRSNLNGWEGSLEGDRKSTRLNSSHEWISYAVFCLKKKRDKAELNVSYVSQ